MTSDRSHEAQPAGSSTDPLEPGPSTPPTGHPEVDDVLARLGELDDAELADQVDAYEQIHDRLAGVIDRTGDQPAGSGAG